MNIIELLNTQANLQTIIKERPILLGESELSELRGDLPKEYFALLCRFTYIEIWGKAGLIHFFTIEDAEWINWDSDYVNELPFLYFFADDNGDRLYAFDPENKWKNGVNAIYMISKGCLVKESSTLLGPALSDVINKIPADTSFSDYPRLSSN